MFLTFCASLLSISAFLPLLCYKSQPFTVFQLNNMAKVLNYFQNWVTPLMLLICGNSRLRPVLLITGPRYQPLLTTYLWSDTECWYMQLTSAFLLRCCGIPGAESKVLTLSWRLFTSLWNISGIKKFTTILHTQSVRWGPVGGIMTSHGIKWWQGTK